MPTRRKTHQPDQKSSKEPAAQPLKGEKLVYRVAELAWVRGLSANNIAKTLGGADQITKVKHALGRARQSGILSIRQPPSVHLHALLESNRSWKARQYTVVNEERFAEIDSVCLAAAEATETIVQKLLAAKPPREIVVANSGGATVSKMVRYLQDRAPQLSSEDSGRLVFLSLNSAGERSTYDFSSNFLAVRLAEIFGGRHLVVLEHASRDAKQYVDKVRRIDLLICGAGDRGSIVGNRAKENDVDLPEAVVGDIVFIPLDIEGREVSDPKLSSAIQNLNTHISYQELQRIAIDPHREVLAIFNHEERYEIAHAVLTAGLATHCVLSVSLANKLHDMFGGKGATAQSAPVASS